jgi:2-polyprenyl-3-methyl-5-hydroxy-6-metoxy-1,4-benzoquinol methylase
MLSYNENSFPNDGSSVDAKNRYLNSLGKQYGEFLLGENTTRILNEDPKLLLFTLSRYKFVSKILAGRRNVLEIGCQEGWGLPLVRQTVQQIHAVDFFKPYIESCRRRISLSGVTFSSHDILAGPVNNNFDGVFALDVLEHIDPDMEQQFIENCKSSMSKDGVLILGTPSLESQKYASEASLAGHVNCKTGQEFKHLMESHFRFTMVFSMNDEVLHTGFYPMSQYVFGIGALPK